MRVESTLYRQLFEEMFWEVEDTAGNCDARSIFSRGYKMGETIRQLYTTMVMELHQKWGAYSKTIELTFVTFEFLFKQHLFKYLPHPALLSTESAYC